MPEVTAALLTAWLAAYEQAWRAPGTEGLAALFTDDAEYLLTPYDDPVTGIAALRIMWEDERAGPGEAFTMSAEVVACSGDTGVAKVLVRYGDPTVQEYLDLWVLRFADGGRVRGFEEWPFWPTHGRGPARSEARVLARAEVAPNRWTEWVRTETLSAGVYRVAAGVEDDQSPHGQDEVYVVTAGAAGLEVDGVVAPVESGSVAFVPRLVPHRFVDVTTDLEVAVVFAPPESPA